MVRTPDPENDLKWLKNRETRLQIELRKTQKQIEVLEGKKISEVIADDCGCDETGEKEKSDTMPKKKTTKKKKE
ncbi:MAG: hypothetical protein KAJ19_11025 [Gammaproteobacteria bacterium]|nr:hypothetical protein [Gammaproteobacteria bacterium]